MSKQTSIEWLIEQCPRINTIASLELIEKAKQMHKEEVKEGYIMVLLDGDNKIRRDAEDYYQETYGGNK